MKTSKITKHNRVTFFRGTGKTGQMSRAKSALAFAGKASELSKTVADATTTTDALGNALKQRVGRGTRKASTKSADQNGDRVKATIPKRKPRKSNKTETL